MVLTLFVIGVAACGDVKDLSFCDAYADYLDDLAAVRALDAEELSASEAAEVAEDFLESVRRLQQVADDTNDTTLIALEGAAADVLRTLESVEDEDEYSTWAPLVEDSIEDAADAAVTVENRYEAECPVTDNDD